MVTEGEEAGLSTLAHIKTQRPLYTFIHIHTYLNYRTLDILRASHSRIFYNTSYWDRRVKPAAASGLLMVVLVANSVGEP